MDAAEARRLFRYDPVSGALIWRVSRGKAAAGQEAGYRNDRGYRAVNISRKMQYAHRIAWLIMTGEWPSLVDHANGDPSDNRWANLRLASKMQNSANSKRPSTNSTGVKGVSLFKRTGRYAATIRFDGKIKHLGYFATKEEAGSAYAKAAEKHFGQFSRLQ